MTLHRPQTPRDHLVSPGSFGHAAQVDWRQPTSLEWLIHLRHAEVQHAFVARIRQTIRETRGLSQAAIARGGSRMENGTFPLYPYKRLNDGINGHKRMSLVDMQRIELITGPILPSLHWSAP